MKILKPNLILLLFSFLCVFAFCFTFYLSWTARERRLSGKLLKTQIIKIDTGKYSYFAIVDIEGERYSAGSIDHNKSVGDSILVRYIPCAYCIVQERVNPSIYYLYFAIESILLIAGIALFVESLEDKNIWSYIKDY